MKLDKKINIPSIGGGAAENKQKELKDNSLGTASFHTESDDDVPF
jgi:hypothetical protein